ncbi:MAG: hypothetical protein HY246_03845 [Proteobacteria bacterium]|nr:hypothetical protein [Pseudomonadota bacterium]
MSLAVAACGPVPRPFQPDVKSEDNPLLLQGDRAGVVIGAIAGLTGPEASQVAAALAEALRRENVPASTHGGNAASLRLAGYVEPSPRGRGAIFRLLDGRGTPIAVPFPAIDLSNGALQAGAATVAKAVAAVLQTNAAAPPVQRQVAVWRVSAPPEIDGLALTRALEFTLRRAQIAVTDSLAENTLVVAGEIAVKPKRADLNSIAVLWTVLKPDGGEVGQIRQDNDVPAELMRQRWPEIALAIAEWAAEGIADLLNRSPSETP